ncbi:MAG TPA: hypothetical protein VGP72_26990 [Planctomycetota bacterium]
MTNFIAWIKTRIYSYRCCSFGYCFLSNTIAVKCPRCKSSAIVDE